MKKLIVPVLIACILSITACSSSDINVETTSDSLSTQTVQSSQDNGTLPNASSLQDVYEHMAASEFLPEMAQVESDLVSDLYGFDSADYTESVIYLSLDETLPDEIAMVVASDDEAAERIEEMLYARLDANAEYAKGRSSEQYAIIASCSVERHGNNVALIICNNAKDLTDIYLNFVEQTS